MQRDVDQLMHVVDRYDLRADGGLAHALGSLRKRIAAHQLTLAVFSDSQESKSSLIRALLNTTPAEASIPPCTAACTYLVYAPKAECAVTLANGMTARLPLEQLAEFVNEKVSESDLKKVLVRFPNPALENGLVVIDTPELREDPEPLLSSAAAAISDADACVFVVNADAVKAGEGLKENVIAFLRGMQGKLKKFFLVLENSADVSDAEREKSRELIKQSLERRCGRSKVPIALLSAFSPEAREAKLRAERPEPCLAKLLEFARMSWQSSTSDGVACVAEKAGSALRLRETTSLQRVRLRRVVRTLEDISRQSAWRALENDRAMHASIELAKSVEPAKSDNAASQPQPSPGVAAQQSSLPYTWLDRSGAIAPEARQVDWQRIREQQTCDQHAAEQHTPDRQNLDRQTWEPTLTTNFPPASARILSFPGGASFGAWVAPPTATTVLAQELPRDRSSKDTTTVPIPSESAQTEWEHPVTAPVPPVSRRAVPRMAEPPDIRSDEDSGRPQVAVGRTSARPEVQEESPGPVEPAPRSARWPAERDTQRDVWRNAWAEAADEDDFMQGDGRRLTWRVAGAAALLAAVLTIAWAAVVIVRPDLRQMGPLRVAAALLAPLRSGKSSSVAPVAAQSIPPQPSPAQPAPPQPLPAQSAAPNSGGAALAEGASPRPAETLPSNGSDENKTAAPSTAGTADQNNPSVPQKNVGVPQAPPPDRAAATNLEHVSNAPPDPALESALDRWIEASRSGDVQAQAASYAPVVGTYFDSRNVTREQVQAEKERTSTGTAGIQNYRITTIGISALANGQRAVLLQKDWDTPTGQGNDFASAEFERLVFAKVQGEWKIVDEQEVKLRKLHRTKTSRQDTANP